MYFTNLFRTKTQPPKKTQEKKLIISVDEFQQYELQRVRLISTQNPN